MGRSRFPGKPLKFQNRKRISVLSGVVYNESRTESQAPADGATANVFTGEKEEEEKKESNNKNETRCTEETVKEKPVCSTKTESKKSEKKESESSPVRTRSQNKMDPVKTEKPKPVKKTVTFGTVESCEDTFLPLKKLPSKNQAPLASIIKKKSALKQTEYSTFNSILKPAKLTDLSSKSSDHQEGYLRKNLNPLSKPINKFSHFSESRCLSPPPRNNSPIDKETSNRFVLPVRSAHSSRVIKPNKKFIDGEEQTSTVPSSLGSKLLKKPKLKKVVFNNLNQNDDSPDEQEEKSEKDKSLLSLNLFKEKTPNSFSGLSSSRNLFSIEKESEFSQDENSNLEGVAKVKTNESSKDERAGHALRKLMDISDASSTSTSDSESESWESESGHGSGNEEEPIGSPEREKAPASQLLSGKVIIREARLQLNTPAPPIIGPDGPFSSFTCNSPTNQNIPVTCGVCGAVRFYKFVKQARKFGIYSCESCRKFVSKMIKKEKVTHNTGPHIMHCLKREGNCHVPPIVRSQQWKFKGCANKSRCPACWLKMCLKAFQVPPSIRAGLTAMLPTYMKPATKPTGPLTQVNPLRLGASNTLTGQTTFGALANNENENGFSALKPAKKVDVEETAVEEPVKVEEKPKKEQTPVEEVTNKDVKKDLSRKRRLSRVKVRKKDKKQEDSKQVDDSKRQKVELKGPRVKHVCRSASIVLGQPIATFPTTDVKERDKSMSEDDSQSDEKEIATLTPLEITVSCDIEAEIENKAPQIVPEVPIKDPEVEVQVEAKKRKVETVIKPKMESSEDETVLELVPRKTILKPITNTINSRGRPQKCSQQNRPELICVDFWESYDPDEVCSSGFGIIGSATFTVSRLCFLCGSAGNEKMLVCSSCCESYHSWCVEQPGSEGWLCARCVACAWCGNAAAKAICRACGRNYHDNCLPVKLDRRADWPQICNACLKCKSCDSSRVSKFVGSLPFCSSCFKLRQKGNFCPLCQACYRDNDFDSKMMECGWCARWVHASCEGLSGEGYQLLSALPPSIEYICRQCMPNEPPWRKMLTEHLKGRLLHLLKLLAKNKKACALLKLTPHKNTPVPNKLFRVTSPQAIRKLHFDDPESKSTETKVYRNTSRSRRTIPTSKPDESSNIWQCSILNDVQMKEEIPHASHKVVNLQEPLMQNKEICFTTGLFDTKAEFETPCVEVHENNPAGKSNDAMLPTTVHDDKYDAISDDDEPMKNISQVRSEQDLSPAISRLVPGLEDADDPNRSPSLLDIKKMVNNDDYVSLKDFNHDMKEVINRLSNVDLKSIYKSLFMETFPWFDCENNCLQPNLEVEGEHDDAESLKQETTETKGSIETMPCNDEKPPNEVVPKIECDDKKVEEDLFDFNPVHDLRVCVLCKVVGDGPPAQEGRLLYCGQNDWIHANCALWSAEVFEEIDGSLQNVHSAISRGKMIKCAACELKGASVGCCAKNCSETYHYACARKESCAFMDDKRVFCSTHGKEVPKKSLQKDADFELTRPVYVELDKKKKRYSEINKVQFLMGSLTVHSLGKIVPSVSDFEEFLMPVDFSCSRLFWSSKKPSKIVRYTIRTKFILSEPLPGFDFGVNITVDHSMDVQVVERVMAEIGAWHESIDNDFSTASLMMKIEKSPKKYGVKVSLEDLAVKQVVEFLLDTVCKLEQDEEEPQNTADLLPPELKDAIFEDLNHDLLDGISMQDIFPKLMSYEDLVSMDVMKNEIYGAMNQSDDKSDKDSRSTTDFIDELLNARLEPGSKELKRSKSEMLLQNHNLKSLSTGRGQQRSSSLTWNNKFDSNLLSSTIKRCKIGRTATTTGKLSPVQRTTLHENEKVHEASALGKKLKSESSDSLCVEIPNTSASYHSSLTKEKDDDTNADKSDKSEGYYADVIDFYTKIQCSPISQLDGAADWSGSESTCSSRPASPRENEDFTPIQQLDGAEDNQPNEIAHRQTNQFLYRASGTESTYTVTIAGNSLSGQPEFVMRPLDEQRGGHLEQPVRCDRCQCTYRNKESFERHVPTCDMMSTSESESETPKSPENRTLTTLQNAFQGAFAQPMIIHAGVVSGTENTVKAEGISARRTSINTRQITINGTIVETPSPGPSNEMTMTITEQQMKSGTVFFDQSKATNVHMTGSQQVMSSPQIVVTPQMLLPSKTSSAGGQKIMTPQIITQQGVLPYNICVKPGNGGANIQQIQSGTDVTQLLSGAGGIQVLTSNSNQVLTIPANQQGSITPIIQGKNQIANFPNMASASSIAMPVNSIQGMPNTSLIQNIQPMIRQNIQGNTIVVPAMTTQRLSSPNNQIKQQILLPGNTQKSPKKQPPPVQPKPIFQATNRARGKPIPKPATIKRHTKVEKTFTTINQPLGAGNTVIQLQTNNQTGQPSIIVQPVSNQNIMSAYVEALSQQQNQNMQYIATIGPQGDFKTGHAPYISQGGIMPQTFQLQQTESGLVAVPSGGIPVLLSQGNVGILPQTLQQGATILPQGTIQQGIISQGPNGPTILPQAIHTQNGATIIPQGAIQGLTSGSGATVVPQSGIGNTQTTILPNTLQGQGNTLISSGPGATILPQGTILPQFCNDQVLLGSTPTLEMVTDSSGCMYLTTQPVYYGLETIVQNTVMSSQQFVSTAMQGVLAQNSSFSATTTQVFQASKIEPIVEVPTGYVVVNNVGDASQVSTSAPNIVTAQSVQNSPQTIKNMKTPIPNLTLQPLPDKSNSNGNRQTHKVIHMGPVSVAVGSQNATIITGRSNINPNTSHIHTMSLSSTPQNISRSVVTKVNPISMAPNVTLVSSSGHPVMAISQSIPNTSFSMQPLPLSQPIVSSSIAPSLHKNVNTKIENAHVIEIGGNLHDNSVPTINLTPALKSPTPWRQISTPNSSANIEAMKNLEIQNNIKTSCAMSSAINLQNNVLKHSPRNESEKINQNCLIPISISNSSNVMTSSNNLHQFDSSINTSHHSNIHTSSNNVIQISAGNIYAPCTSVMSTTFDTETAMKLSKINALSKAEGGHLNFSQEIMASHSQQHAQNEKSFQNIGNTDNTKHLDTMNNQMNIHKLSSCQVVGNAPSINLVPHNVMRPPSQSNQNSSSMPLHNNHNQVCSISTSNNVHSMQMQSSGANANMSCQEVSGNRNINLNVANENLQQTNSCNSQQHDIGNSAGVHGNMSMISHENSHHSTNHIHIMSGQIQHNRQMESASQHQQNSTHNQNQQNRFHDNVVGGSQGHQVNINSNRSTPDSNNLMNHSLNMHNMSGTHNISRPSSDLSHLHMQQSSPSINNMPNNRMMMDNMQSHSMNNVNHQMHSNRQLDNMHSQIAQQHGMSQMNHHLNTSSRQIENNIHMNQQMAMQNNRQIDNPGHHHQMSNVMQMQSNRQHLDGNIMGMHQHMPNQMHNRQIDNNIHMHHMAGGPQNIGSANQMENPGPMTSNIQGMHGRHDTSSMGMQNVNSLNQMQGNRNTMEHPPLLHSINNINSMNNIGLHNNVNASMQMGNTSHQPMMHVPEIKNDMQSSCSGSCSNNSQFSSNQSSFEMTNMNMATSGMMHSMNVNNSNMPSNMMMNSGMYGSNIHGNMSGHDMLLSCNNSADHVNNLMSSNANHMIMNGPQSHSNNNQSQMMNTTQVANNNTQININNCNLNTNSSHNQVAMESPMNRSSMGVTEQNKFVNEPCRGKNIMSHGQNPNMVPLQNVPNSDCAKVNIVNNDKPNHTISVNNPMGFMSMNTQNNRNMNGRLTNTNLEHNMNQHMPQQHNIRVVTNNTNNISGLATEALSFQQKNENTGTMINVPFQAIPNSAPMNINVNSSNNTVNITVQNNLVDPKIASKSVSDINFPLQTNTLQNQSNNGNMICIPVQNSTINLQTQNSSSITLPKAPSTQQSGIPTNVVTPMSMRPMNRVLPLHRDGQSKAGSKAATTTKAPVVPTPRTVSHDMPDLNMKDETVDSDLEKAIEESKRMMKLEKAKREKEELERAQLSSLASQANTSANITSLDRTTPKVTSNATIPIMPSLPSLDVEMEVLPSKILKEKEPNNTLVQTKLASPTSKVTKRSMCDKKTENEAVTKKLNKSVKGQENIIKITSHDKPKQVPDPPKDDGPKLIYEVTSEDGFCYSSSSLTDLWAKVVEAVQNARKSSGLSPIQYNLPTTLAGAHLLGLNNNGLRYLVEQLPGASRCTKYKIKQGRQLNSWDNDLDLSEGFKESPWGSARIGPVNRKLNLDMFSWMASPFREEPPPFSGQEAESLVSRRLATLPLAMRFRHLKETSKVSVGVYRSHIHGRGLFCKKDIEEGDMVIEYAGEVIRAVLADQREKRYEAMRGRRGVAGCYMFRIDDNLVVDATLKGNSARFINHSCDPNCYSRVVDIHGHKHILIFALRRISIGEELTYDYKFPFEEVKIPCTCGAKKCRKYLN